MASSSNEHENDTPIVGIRDVKEKRKDDEIKMTITPCDEAKSEIVEPSLVQLPVVTEKENELDRTLNGTPVRIARVPRNRTLQDSVKAHLAVFGESARQDPVPSLLTRLSDSYVPPANSTKARNILGDCQQDSGDNDHARHLRKNPSHYDNLPNTDSLGLHRPSSPRSQDSRMVPNYSTRAGKEKPTNFKNSHVSVNIIHRLPLILSMSSARAIVRQDSVTTSTSVEDNAMTLPSYQSRSSPVTSISQNQVDLSNQIPHVQSFIDGPLAHSTSLNSVETRARLLARLEMEKRQVVQLSVSDNNYSHHDRPSCSSSFSIVDCDPLEPDEDKPDVRDLASDTLVSEGSRKRESKLRARAHAQLRVRLATEKRMNLDG